MTRNGPGRVTDSRRANREVIFRRSLSLLFHPRRYGNISNNICKYMSIAISVESFSYLPNTEPFQSETSVRKAYVAWRADLLQQICLHFGWRNAPWDELHTKTTPESDSLMWSTYHALYSLA